MKKKFSTYETLCKLPLGGSLWGLLFFFIFMLASCTNDVAEVETSSQQGQYVTVRMNIPGMTINASRTAVDGLIETVDALAFNSEGTLLGTSKAANINNNNENNGYNGTFSLTVPNGTTTIHFLANLPGDYDLTGVKTESDLCNLSIGDWQNLRYWGKATYDGNNSTISTTLYRNLARISIMPSVTDPEFNDFTQEQLKMTGFYMPNEWGALVPNNDGVFDFDMNSNYCTIPSDVTSKNYELYSFTSMYALEHVNTDSNPTYIICKIGDYHYKVALADDEGNRYPIIRNHEYIIYVSDVDDYSYDTNYRAETYEEAFEKLPINLEVEVIELLDVKFSPTEQQTVQMGNTLSISMTVPTDRTLTNFSIKAEGFTFNTPNDTYEAGTTTFTFTPKNVGDYTITFTGSGENLNPVNTTINVKVTEMPKATFNYTDNQTIQVGNSITVTMNVPEGGTLNTLNITADGFTIKQGDSEIGTNSYNGTNLNYTNKTITYTFVSTSAGSKTITFSGSGNNINVPQTTVNVTVQEVEKKELQYSYGSTTLYMKDSNGEANPTSLAVKVTVPDGSTLNSLTIAASGFIIKNGEKTLSENGSYTYTEGASTTFTFTPTGAGTKTITFSGTNENLNVDKTIEVTVVDGNAPSEIVLWEEDIIVSWTAFELEDERLKDADEITFDVEVSDADERQIQLNMPGYLYISKESLPKNEKVTITVSTTQSSMPPDGTLKITGQNVTITKIYIIPASTP